VSRPWRPWALAAVTAAAAWLSCFRPVYESGNLACDDTADDACPTGFSCVHGRCWRSGEEPSADGGEAEPRDGRAPGGTGGGDAGGGRGGFDGGPPRDAPAGGGAGISGGSGGGAAGGGGGGADAPEGDPAQLGSLAFSAGVLSPSFSPATSSYDLNLPLTAGSVTVTATLLQPAAGTTIVVNGVRVTSGVTSPAFPIAVGTTQVTVRVETGGGSVRQYTVTVIRGGLVTYLKASNTDAEDEFGAAIASSGDTLVVGAAGEDSNAPGRDADNTARDSGAVYVFVRSTGGAWIQQAYLKATSPRAGDRFGRAVAISGNTLAVGAPGQDSNATGVGGAEDNTAAGDSGAVYVFVRNAAGLWSQQAFIKASNTGAGDRFGGSVALSGDTLAVGAPYEGSNATGVNGNERDNSAGDSGAAYVFARANNAWSQQAYLKASNTQGGDRFGEAIAVSGDVIAVGAPFEDGNATGLNGNGADNSQADSGAVYVFARANPWSQQAYVKASNTGGGDRFGHAVAISGDVLVVGAPYEDSDSPGVNGNQASNAAADSGAVYVFRRAAPWSQQAYVKPLVVDANDHFGVSVAVGGGFVVAGAPDEDGSSTVPNNGPGDNSAREAGALYVFRTSGNSWVQHAYLKAPNAQAGDRFGAAAAASSEVVAAGAYEEDSSARGVGGNQQDNGAMDSGAAYAF
jgi:hypothetical protein